MAEVHLGGERGAQVVLDQRVLRAQLDVAGLGGAGLRRLVGNRSRLVRCRGGLWSGVLYKGRTQSVLRPSCWGDADGMQVVTPFRTQALLFHRLVFCRLA